MRWDQERATGPVEFDVEVVEDGNRPVVILKGDLDLSTVGPFTAALDSAVAMCGGAGGGIELDLRETTFMGSTGLTALIAAHQRLGQVPEAIVLRDPSPSVRRLLDLAGVEDLFTLRETGVRITAGEAVSPPPPSTSPSSPDRGTRAESGG